jgi:hypothetical protein
MPKSMMIVSQVIGGSTNIMPFGEPPASQAASRDCSPLGTSKILSLSGIFHVLHLNFRSGARASLTMGTTRKP